MFLWKGNNISVGIYGQSHASEIGVEMTGFPKEKIDFEELLTFLARRKASSGVFSTKRQESDIPHFVQGVEENQIVADKVKAVIYNENVKSGDYSNIFAKPRPSHADYSAYKKDGRLDFSGGGEFSGRMTAPYAIAGGIAKQILKRQGIEVNAYVSSIGTVNGKSFKDGDIKIVANDVFPSLSKQEEMLDEIAKAKSRGDSVGGRVDCVVRGLDAGYGGALFDGLEGKIAYLVYAIPAVKGVEFGDGFDLSRMNGSVANDAWRFVDGKVVSKTNRSGGINGGISNGMPITLSVAFRPTPSIAIEQETVDLQSRENVKIIIHGRHDACIVPRAVPVVESAICLAILDSIM